MSLDKSPTAPTLCSVGSDRVVCGCEGLGTQKVTIISVIEYKRMGFKSMVSRGLLGGVIGSIEQLC